MSLGLGVPAITRDIYLEWILSGKYGTDEGLYEVAYSMYNGLTREEAFEQVFKPLHSYVDDIVLPSEKKGWTNVLERFREVAWWIYPN